MEAPKETPSETELFDPSRDPRADLAAAREAAAKDGKDILLALGARWCPDCTAFEDWIRDPEVAQLLERKYHLVPVSVGSADGRIDTLPPVGRGGGPSTSASAAISA